MTAAATKKPDKTVKTEKSGKYPAGAIIIDGYVENGGWRGTLHNLALDIKRNKLFYLICIPVVAYYLLFHYAPSIGVVVAFQKYSPVKGFFGSQWVGLANFEKFLSTKYFWRLMKNTIVLSLLNMVFTFTGPIAFALLLNEIRHKKFKRVAQTVSYLPHFISTVVVAGIIIQFCGTGGLISELVASVTGTTSKNLLGISAWFRPIFIFSELWQGIGFGSIIYLATLSGVDVQLYEAARMDGANRWKQMLYVTLPALAPLVMLQLIMRTGTILSVASDKILLIYNSAIYDVADVIGTYTYRQGLLQGDFSYTAAIGLFNQIIGMILMLITNKISRKTTGVRFF